MENTANDYILCVDDRSLAEAISVMKSSSAVVLDCEGEDLGQEGGTLSLISLQAIAPETSKIYLIDTISLARNKLNPIFDIIQSPSPTKIVFDGRMDFSALYHGYNVNMHGVLDLQLADVHSRRQRGETEEGQLRRLSPFLHLGAVLGQPNSFTSLHKLCGLEQCMKEHSIVTNDPGGNQLDHSLWLSRPLPELYLNYASRDVYLVGLLYAHFGKKGYMNDQLPAQSARYASIWQAKQPTKTETFKQHPILPLRILDFNDYSQTKSCVGCQRDLPEKAYSRAAWNGVSRQRCWVCRAINERNALHKGWNRDSDYDDDDDDGLDDDGLDDYCGSYYDSDSDNYGYCDYDSD